MPQLLSRPSLLRRRLSQERHSSTTTTRPVAPSTHTRGAPRPPRPHARAPKSATVTRDGWGFPTARRLCWPGRRRPCRRGSGCAASAVLRRVRSNRNLCRGVRPNRTTPAGSTSGEAQSAPELATGDSLANIFGVRSACWRYPRDAGGLGLLGARARAMPEKSMLAPLDRQNAADLRRRLQRASRGPRRQTQTPAS